MAIFQQGAFQIDPTESPQSIARKRALVQSMMMQYGKASNIGEGLGQLFNGIAVGAQNNKINKAEQAGIQSGNSARDAIFNMLSGGASAPSVEAPKASGSVAPVSRNATPVPGNINNARANDRNSVPGYAGLDMKSGIQQSANALGISPVDLATAISYETAGTMDPTKRGPTTQWGQHRGLIQFGEPQAQKYGVDWNNPISSQLGENGAVVKYLKDAGVQPGMGMMDVYSAINAGRVGRYNASDANNGGAPGTVADKVNGQMASHRAKAMAMFGDPAQSGSPFDAQPGMAATASPAMGYTGPAQINSPAPAPKGGLDLNMLMQQAQNPWLDDNSRAMVNNLIEQEMTRQRQASDPAYQIDLQLKQAQLKQALNPAPQFDIVTGKDGSILRVNKQTGENQVIYGPQPDPVKPTSDIQEYEYAKKQGFNGTFADYQQSMKKAGAQSINIDQKAESQFDKTLAEKQAASFDTMATDGMNAKADLAVIGELGGLLQGQGGMLTGMSAALAKYGIGGQNVGDLQAADALINRLIPAQRQAGSGSMSDRDVEMFKASLPSMWKTPEGNQRILRTMQGLAQYKQAQGDIAQRVMMGEISRQDAIKMLRELPNPLADFGDTKNAPATKKAPVQINGYTIEQVD